MALLDSLDARDLTRQAIRLRVARNQSQKEFWSKFGISQACASRIECTCQVPAPVYILLSLYMSGGLDESALGCAQIIRG
jgi:hypothetical protein